MSRSGYNEDVKGTCGSCKYRGEIILNNDFVDSGYFLCDRIKQRLSHGCYDLYPKGEKAIVKDGSGYYAALCVENDFGCILWEAAAAE